MKKLLCLTVVLLPILLASPAFASPYRSTNSFTAPLHVLGEDTGGIWFGGFYYGAVALRFDRKSETWESFFKPLDNVLRQGAVVRANGFLFYGAGHALFDEKKREWRTPGSIPSPKETADDLRSFREAGMPDTLPLHAFEVYKKYFPKKASELVDEQGRLDRKFYQFEQNIISPVKIGHKVWFGITFYSGEGINGVGGIGFYDEQLGKTGILRLPELIKCSVRSMKAEGAMLRIEQIRNTEAGEYSCGPPIYLNTETGDITLYTLPQNASLRWEEIHSTMQVGSETWIAMDAGLLRIFTDGTWNLYALDRVAVQQETPAYSGPGYEATAARVEPGDYRLLWGAYDIGRGASQGYLEVSARQTVAGWVDNKSMCEKRKPDDYMTEAGPCPLRAQPSYDAPLIGWLGPAPLKVIEQHGRGWEKIEAESVWIPAQAALLRPRLFSKGSGYRESRVPWPFTDPIEKVMLRTAKEERLAAEEEEKAKPVPHVAKSSPSNSSPISIIVPMMRKK